MGKLTTHVLDTTHGCPAQGVEIRLFGEDGAQIAQATTNADGRCDAPLLEGAAMKNGRYRLEFEVAEYYRERGEELPETPFLDIVTINFGIADANGHYHVPLLVSPYGYSTYRGS